MRKRRSYSQDFANGRGSFIGIWQFSLGTQGKEQHWTVEPPPFLNVTDRMFINKPTCFFVLSFCSILSLFSNVYKGSSPLVCVKNASWLHEMWHLTSRLMCIFLIYVYIHNWHWAAMFGEIQISKRIFFFFLKNCRQEGKALLILWWTSKQRLKATIDATCISSKFKENEF